METIPCIKNKCLKYPICKYKEYIECEDLYAYYIGLYTHYKKDSNQLNQHDAFNNIYSKAIEHIQTSLPNIKGITGRWNDRYTEYVQIGSLDLKGSTKSWINSYVK